MNEMFVPCGMCGKLINPLTAYYMARRSKSVGSHGDWEYVGISPVFYACSYEHFAAQTVVMQMQWRELSMKAFNVVPQQQADKPIEE